MSIKKWYEDHRAIGMRCILRNTPHRTSVIGSLSRVTIASNGNSFYIEGMNSNDTYNSCQIAQGDKTAYDDKGQPVPDDVVVKVWIEHLDQSMTFIMVAQQVFDNWEWVRSYQVQGMIVKEEE
jgi:hypothetical protein